MGERTEHRTIDLLKNWEQNPRGILKDDFERLKKQLQRFGQYKPILITEDGTVLGGNMRLKAMQELGITDVWVSVVDAPDEKTRLEYALSDNDRSGYYEEEKLAELVMSVPDLDLKEYKVDLGKLTNLDDLLSQYGPDAVEDEVPDVLTDEPISRTGEVYQLGRHRLMCGDSTKKEDVERLMDGKKADMVFTDPPYNIASDGMNYAATGETTKKTYAALRDSEWDKNFNIKPALDNLSSFSSDSCAVYVCTSSFLFQTVIDWANQFYRYNSYIVWCKPNPTPSMAKRHWTFATELIVYAVRGKHTSNFPERKNFLNHYGYTEEQAQEIEFMPEMNYWRVIKETHTEDHPTQKPIRMITKPIRFSSKVDDVVLDLFLGSGSTLIACEQTNRICYGMEIDNRYIDVIINRYCKFTGNYNIKRNGEDIVWQDQSALKQQNNEDKG
jgi:ParB family chromosome partitioning protein